MRGADIVNRLKEVLPKYTNDFSDFLTITSLVKSGSTITATTSANHGLVTGSYVTIRNAKEPITITSMTRSGNIVSVVTSTDCKLSDPSLYSQDKLPIMIELSGNTPSDYNGSFELVSVTDDFNFSFKINTAPSNPSVLGYLLLKDYDGYNGYKQITATSPTTFTYSSPFTIQSPAQGSITCSYVSRLAWGATPERVGQFYSEDSSRTLQKWMFVVIGSKTIYKNDTTATDLVSAKRKGEVYHFDSQQDFSIFVFMPAQSDTLGGATSDTARLYEKPILKSLANYSFASNLTQEYYEPATYVGNEPEEYNTAIYVHRFDFLSKGYVVEEDVSDENQGVPLKLIDGAFDNGLEFKPVY